MKLFLDNEFFFSFLKIKHGSNSGKGREGHRGDAFLDSIYVFNRIVDCVVDDDGNNNNNDDDDDDDDNNNNNDNNDDDDVFQASFPQNLIFKVIL